MKSVITFAALAFIVIAVSCKKDNSNFDPALAGSWKINSFVDNGNDKTNSFAPYTLTFDSHGGLSIDNGSMNYMCGYTKDNNIYHFNMMGMDGGSSMEDLDDDWMLNDINDSTCTFVDDNPSRDCTFTMQRL